MPTSGQIIEHVQPVWGCSRSNRGRRTHTKDNSDDNLRKMDRAFEMANSNRSIDLAAVRASAESALLRGPLNARALRILGQVADAGGNAADVLKFMFCRHEAVAPRKHRRLLDDAKSAEGGDYKTAVFYADALLRTNPGLAPSWCRCCAFRGETAGIQVIASIKHWKAAARGATYSLNISQRYFRCPNTA